MHLLLRLLLLRLLLLRLLLLRLLLLHLPLCPLLRLLPSPRLFCCCTCLDPAHTQPLWSDLITNTTSQNKIEIDVARVQMLFFTLVTATFVGITVFTSYVIPEIPNGFQILMGISNAVYMGSKVSQK